MTNALDWFLVFASIVAGLTSLSLFVTAFAAAFAGDLLDGALIGAIAASAAALAYCANELSTDI